MTVSHGAVARAISPPLYSQTQPDERGNRTYTGDLYRLDEGFDGLIARLEAHLVGHFPDLRFSITRQSFAGGRSITAEVVGGARDLSDAAAREALITAVTDQMERFGFLRSNFYQDYMNVSFYASARIGQSYWASLAKSQGVANPVQSKISLAEFKRRLQPGDTLTLRHSSLGQRFVGVTRKMIKARSSSLVLEGPSYLDYPKAAAFACDGRFIRIAIGSEYEPDAHLLYEWCPTNG